MIFKRALQRELASVAGATFTVLFTILVTWTLISILGRAAGGKVASSDILALIGFSVLNYLPTILILTSFISVLAAITRSYRDSEMVVWFVSGQSLSRWIAPVMLFGLPIVLVVAALSMVAMPWGQLKSNEFTERFQKREDLQRVADDLGPGVGVGQGDDQLSRHASRFASRVEPGQEGVDLLARRHSPQRLRMKGRQNEARLQIHPQHRCDLRPAAAAERHQVVHAGRTDGEDPLRRFAHLQQPAAIGLCGGEMQRRQLGDRERRSHSER